MIRISKISKCKYLLACSPEIGHQYTLSSRDTLIFQNPVSFSSHSIPNPFAALSLPLSLLYVVLKPISSSLFKPYIFVLSSNRINILSLSMRFGDWTDWNMLQRILFRWLWNCCFWIGMILILDWPDHVTLESVLILSLDV